MIRKLVLIKRTWIHRLFLLRSFYIKSTWQCYWFLVKFPFLTFFQRVIIIIINYCYYYYYYCCLDLQKVSLFQISMSRFVDMLKHITLLKHLSTFGCGQAAKLGKNQEIHRILFKKAWRVLSFPRRRPPREGRNGYFE